MRLIFVLLYANFGIIEYTALAFSAIVLLFAFVFMIVMGPCASRIPKPPKKHKKSTYK